MIINEIEIWHGLIIILSILGFFISFYISHKKNTNRPLVCPMRTSCDTVTKSSYSKFFNVPVEELGLFYYGLVFFLHVFYFLIPAFFDAYMNLFSISVAMLAFVFSLYLIALQAFEIKGWCSWCLVSALSSTMIFCANFFLLPTNFFHSNILTPFAHTILYILVLVVIVSIVHILMRHYIFRHLKGEALASNL